MSRGIIKHDCEPAASVLRILGVLETARTLGLSKGSVSHWAAPQDKGGSNGCIPRRHRKALAELTAKAGHPLTLEFLNSKDKPMAGGAKSKQKGDRFEREIVNILREQGIDAGRVPLSGAVEGFPGDVFFDLPAGRFLGQCKVSASGDGYVSLSNILAERSMVRIRRGTQLFSDEDIVLMDLSYFYGFLTGLMVAPVNMPLWPGARTGVLDKALSGHHVLFFKKDRGPVNVALTYGQYRSFFLERLNHVTAPNAA